MKDIFVPLEIAKKLKEIGFDEPCIGAYDIYCMLHISNFNDKLSLSKSEIIAYAPTYEQVFKWFREKGYHQEIIFSGLKTDCKSYFFSILKDKTYIYSSKNYPDYIQTRENLILRLIELYQTNSN